MPIQKDPSSDPRVAPERQDPLPRWLRRVLQSQDEEEVIWDDAKALLLFKAAIGGNVEAMRLILRVRLGEPPVMEEDPLDAGAVRMVPVRISVRVLPDDGPSG